MALGALHFLMPAFKLKIGQIMIKGFPWREGGRRVATCAGLRCKLRIEHRLMLVNMAILAVAALLTRKDKLLTTFRRLGGKNNIL
jgi:hypothetical protein